jgi:hypothetical protein
MKKYTAFAYVILQIVELGVFQLRGDQVQSD